MKSRILKSFSIVLASFLVATGCTQKLKEENAQLKAKVDSLETVTQKAAKRL